MIFMVLESIRQAFFALMANKVRTFLTMLGVLIGVFAVVTMVTIGEGAKAYIHYQVNSMGSRSNSIVITTAMTMGAPPNPKFTYGDIRYIKANVPEITGIVAVNPGTGDLYYAKKRFRAPLIMGTTANYAELTEQKVVAGRFFRDSEVEARSKMAVIGPKIARDIFGDTLPLGEKLKLRGATYIIIGVMESKGMVGPMDMDKRVILPVTVAQNMMGTNKIMRMICYLRSEKDIPQVKDKVNQLLLRKFNKDDFSIQTPEGILSMINNILTALTGIVSGIAAISLIVGGVGIMNIMLVAVNERVREIGIRKAIGAKNRDIFIQFVVEASFISFMGGALGILSAIIVSYLVMWKLNAYSSVPLSAIIMALLVSSVVGLISGVYPAMRAAGLPPVEALRYE